MSPRKLLPASLKLNIELRYELCTSNSYNTCLQICSAIPYPTGFAGFPTRAACKYALALPCLRKAALVRAWRQNFWTFGHRPDGSPRGVGASDNSPRGRW